MVLRGSNDQMQLEFTKMQSLGNDFVVLDAVTQSIVLNERSAQQIADRHKGIGCDQILVVEPATDQTSDFRFRIYNADGSEVGQCGNGARCFLKFVIDQGLTDRDQVTIQTNTATMLASLSDDGLVSVDMGEPTFEPSRVPFSADEQAPEYPLEIDSGTIRIGAVSVGNPHAVQVVEVLSDDLVATQGPQVENHVRFPERTNAGFMQIVSAEQINLRVHERGVGETQACGSGACAAVAVGRHQGRLSDEVAVHLPGGVLGIRWQGAGESLFMTGPAETVFKGRMDIVV